MTAETSTPKNDAAASVYVFKINTSDDPEVQARIDAGRALCRQIAAEFGLTEPTSPLPLDCEIGIGANYAEASSK